MNFVTLKSLIEDNVLLFNSCMRVWLQNYSTQYKGCNKQNDWIEDCDRYELNQDNAIFNYEVVEHRLICTKATG